MTNTVTLCIEPGRFHRARTQSFHIITPRQRLKSKLYMLGSTGNEYIIITKKNSISCNCPDKHKTCKHILFLLHMLNIIHRGDKTVMVKPSTIIPSVWEPSALPLLRPHLLDSSVNSMCYQPAYQNCIHCSQPANGTIIICSKCGFLGHRSCYLKRHVTGMNCPRCGRAFYALQSIVDNNGHRNYRNYLNILDHSNCLTSSSRQFTYLSGEYSCKLLPSSQQHQMPIHLHQVNHLPPGEENLPPEFQIPPNVPSSCNIIPALQEEI